MMIHKENIHAQKIAHKYALRQVIRRCRLSFVKVSSALLRTSAMFTFLERDDVNDHLFSASCMSM
jgi:hypothetical protein